MAPIVKPPKKPAVTEEERKLRERVGQTLLDAIIKLDSPFAVEGVHTKPVYKEGMGYKQKPLLPAFEHFLTDFYLGARAQLIFKCYPVEKADYDFFEVDEKSMDAVFPLLGASLAEALGIDECEDFTVIVDTVKRRLIREDQEAAELALEAKKKADEAYTTNPNFGIF